MEGSKRAHKAATTLQRVFRGKLGRAKYALHHKWRPGYNDRWRGYVGNSSARILAPGSFKNYYTSYRKRHVGSPLDQYHDVIKRNVRSSRFRRRLASHITAKTLIKKVPYELGRHIASYLRK